jgi:hypothetical protein
MVSVENQLAWMPSTIGADASRQQPQQLALSAPPDDAPAKEFSLFGDDGFSFADLLDVVNPLQHIPFVSTFYREATGDTLAAAPRVAGSTLFFGPLGLASALANVFVEESTGQDIGQHMAGWINPASEGTDVADDAPAAADAPAAGNLDPADPVLAWARGEADWVKQSLKARNGGAAGTSKADTPAPATEPGDVPDASPYLRDEPAPAEEPFGLADMAYLTQDIRSAARAYAAAANLRPAG